MANITVYHYRTINILWMELVSATSFIFSANVPHSLFTLVDGHNDECTKRPKSNKRHELSLKCHKQRAGSQCFICKAGGEGTQRISRGLHYSPQWSAEVRSP